MLVGNILRFLYVSGMGNPVRANKKQEGNPDQPLLPSCSNTSANDILNSAIVRDGNRTCYNGTVLTQINGLWDVVHKKVRVNPFFSYETCLGRFNSLNKYAYSKMAEKLSKPLTPFFIQLNPAQNHRCIPKNKLERKEYNELDLANAISAGYPQTNDRPVVDLNRVVFKEQKKPHSNKLEDFYKENKVFVISLSIAGAVETILICAIITQTLLEKIRAHYKQTTGQQGSVTSGPRPIYENS